MTTTKETRAHLTLLAAVLAVTLVMITGLGFAIHYALTPTPSDTAASVDVPPVLEVSTRDEIAAAPMLAVSREAARGGTPALGPLPTITIPQGIMTGAEGVPTGYPRTPEGAAGQLSDIVWSVLGSMDLTHARAVKEAWFEDPAGEVWPVMVLIQEFLRAGHLTAGLEPGATMQVEPMAAQIKGSDGDDWHVVCVLAQLTYTYRDQARMAYGHCERMTWIDRRWVIAAGSHPVPAPSTWPGTELAVEAGWRTWVEG